MKKHVKIFKILVACIVLLGCIMIPTLISATSTNGMTTAEFISLLKEVDTYQRLDVGSESNTLLTREKAAAILVKLMGYEGIVRDYKDSTPFKDVQAYKGEISIIKQLGMMSGTSEYTFNPEGIITKEQGRMIVDRLKEKLNTKSKWKHAFYALASSSQMELIPEYDAVSFGWAQVAYDSNKQVFQLESTNPQNDFKIPQGFYQPMDLAKSNQVETYLMVFFEDRHQMAQILFEDTQNVDTLIQEIVSLCDAISKDGVTRSFDGVTIDFENFISRDLQAPYVQFLNKLSKELKENNKKLNVALQPTTYFKGYDYKGIGEVADRVILMAHDYAPKSLSNFEQQVGAVMTPITPINEIYKVFCDITNPTSGVQDRAKIVLQISYGSTQWQVQDSKVMNVKPYTPTYDKIYERLSMSGTNNLYDEQHQNPYATYEQDGTQNIIWYENNKSVQAKIDLAKLFHIDGVSYWRLGTIPQYE